MTNSDLDIGFSVRVDGGELRGRSVGTGDPLLVLHGGPGLSDYSHLFIDELAGWQALCYTQRGPLPSTAPAPYTVARHLADALAVLDHHAVDRAVVVGHSWGACLASLLAAKAPERVRGLVLVDGLGMVGDGHEAEFTQALMARAQHAAAPEASQSETRDAEANAADTEALESLRLVWPAYFADPASAPPLPPDMRLSARCNSETFESLRTALADPATVAAIGSFPDPVEVIYGDASPMPPSAAIETAALFTDAVLTAVPGAGHLVWHEQPGSVTDALRRLLNRLPRQAGG